MQTSLLALSKPTPWLASADHTSMFRENNKLPIDAANGKIIEG